MDEWWLHQHIFWMQTILMTLKWRRMTMTWFQETTSLPSTAFHLTDLRKSVSPLLTESYISLWIVFDPWSLGISFSDIKSEMKKEALCCSLLLLRLCLSSHSANLCFIKIKKLKRCCIFCIFDTYTGLCHDQCAI